jgi:ASC-1-like (ASCH) protein
MSIVVRNSDLNEETLAALNKLVDVDINASVAFKLMRIIKEITSIVDDKNKMEKRLTNKHAEKDEEGDVIIVKDNGGNVGDVNIKDMEAFSADMANLMGIENEIGYEKINFEDLNLKTARVKDLIRLEFLFS